MKGTPIDNVSDAEWTSLAEATSDGEASPVRKHVIEEGEGNVPSEGSTVEIEYAGTLLGERRWSANDVVECWLSQLQGLDHLAPNFLGNDVDGGKLMDGALFTEEYCANALGVGNKIQAKKLIMASRRIARQQDDYPPGTEFDSSASRDGNYSFVLGRGKAIRAMDLAVSGMRVGERALVACRADYGYGSEGLRSGRGDVVVPPFATLCFEIKLVSAT